jgi:hypothetical protein
MLQCSSSTYIEGLKVKEEKEKQWEEKERKKKFSADENTFPTLFAR